MQSMAQRLTRSNQTVNNGNGNGAFMGFDTSSDESENSDVEKGDPKKPIDEASSSCTLYVYNFFTGFERIVSSRNHWSGLHLETPPQFRKKPCWTDSRIGWIDCSRGLPSVTTLIIGPNSEIIKIFIEQVLVFFFFLVL